jgi:hypothetical protein
MSAKASNFFSVIVLTAISIPLGLLYGADFPANPLVKPGWILDHDDEFNGPGLDPNTWSPYYFKSLAPVETSAADYVFRDGALVLKVEEDMPLYREDWPGFWCSSIQTFDKDYLHVGGNAFDHHEPMFDGYTTRYGYFEIRTKLPSGSGGHIAWWMIGCEDSPSEDAEIDIIENGFPGTQNSYSHIIPWEDPEIYYETFRQPYGFDVADEWHIFGFDWRPNGMKFYLDNDLLWETTQSIGYRMLTFLSIYVAGGGWNGPLDYIYPKEFAIDYFRVYKNDPWPGVNIAPLVGTASMDSQPGWWHIAQNAIDEEAQSYARSHTPVWDLTVDLKNVYPVDKVIVRPETVGSKPITFSEGFSCDDPGEWDDIYWSTRISADTGYIWSGGGGQTYGFALYDWSGVGSYFATNGTGQSYEGVNAWTTLDGDYAANVTGIEIEMAGVGLTDSGTVLIEAIIQDANGDWFVSDDTVADTAGTTGIIDATSTTWRQLNSAPVIQMALDVGGAGTPDLSKVYGGGVNFRDLGTGYPSVRIDSLTFVGAGGDTPTAVWADDYTIKVSKDNINWTTVATASGVDDSDRTFNFSPIYARYVRMDVTGVVRADSFGHGIEDFEIYMSATTPPGNALASVTEGFMPGTDGYDISRRERASADTAYVWSGYDNAWGIALTNIGDGVLDFSGANVGYDGWNAWTVFNGDYVTNLQEVSFTWDSSGNSGNFDVQALIKDANDNWFVSDDTVDDTNSQTFIIDATATTWKILNSEPVICRPLDIGSAGVPDLSKIYGGGLATIGTEVGYQTRLDELMFNGVPDYPPTWNSDPMFKASAIEGLDYTGTLATDASDPDEGDTLTYSVVSGPGWLNVASDGQLSGIAADAETGSNAFTVRVTDDGGLYDEATLNVYVAQRYTGELGLSDLTAFAARWLDTGCGACGGADLNDDGDVNMQDWAIFAGYWLK